MLHENKYHPTWLTIADDCKNIDAKSRPNSKHTARTTTRRSTQNYKSVSSVFSILRQASNFPHRLQLKRIYKHHIHAYVVVAVYKTHQLQYINATKMAIHRRAWRNIHIPFWEFTLIYNTHTKQKVHEIPRPLPFPHQPPPHTVVRFNVYVSYVTPFHACINRSHHAGQNCPAAGEELIPNSGCFDGSSLQD